MGKPDKAKLLEFLKGLSEEDRKAFAEAWQEEYGKPLSGDADLLETVRTLQREFEDFKKNAPPKPPAPPAKGKGLLDRMADLFS